MQECRNAGVQEYRNAGVQELVAIIIITIIFRNAGVQERRSEFSNSEKIVNADVSMSVSAPSDRPDDCKGSRDVMVQCPERPFVARIFYRP